MRFGFSILLAALSALSLVAATESDVVILANQTPAVMIVNDYHVEDVEARSIAERDLLGLKLNTCIRLKVATTIKVQKNPGVFVDFFLGVDTCICMDVATSVAGDGGLLSAGVQVVTSAGVTFDGDVALKITQAIQNPSKYPGSAKLFAFVAADVCVQLGLELLGINLGGRHSTHAWPPAGRGSCCARNCDRGYTKNELNQCVPTTPTCNANQILCGGECKNKNRYTCVSGVPIKIKDKRDRACPFDMVRCPIKGLSWGSGWECVDVKTDIESCGGCSSLDSTEVYDSGAQDCTAIANTNEVACHVGRCKIISCRRGYLLSSNGTECLSKQDALLESSAKTWHGLQVQAIS